MTKALAAGAHSVRSRVCHAVHKLMAMVTASERVTSHCMADIAPARRNGLRGPSFLLAKPILNFFFRLHHRKHRHLNFTWAR